MKITVHGKQESRVNESDAYMDALDAELDELVAAGSPDKQADKADDLLKDEPALDISDKKYLDAIQAVHKRSNSWNRATAKEISSALGVSVNVAGRILKELVANGYMVVSRRGRYNVFSLTPSGEELLPPPPEMDSRVPEFIKKKILSKGDAEERIEAINYLYSAVDKAGIGNISWDNQSWIWLYVRPLERKYYLMAISDDGYFASVTFNNPDATTTQRETATKNYMWPRPMEDFTRYVDETIKDIQESYAHAKDVDSKIYSYSFYSSKNDKNVKDKEDMLKVVEGTEGTGMKYYYRYGFAYKGATRREVSYEVFRKYCDHSMVDIDVNYNTMEAEVNEFSENDMY